MQSMMHQGMMMPQTYNPSMTPQYSGIPPMMSQNTWAGHGGAAGILPNPSAVPMNLPVANNVPQQTMPMQSFNPHQAQPGYNTFNEMGIEVPNLSKVKMTPGTEHVSQVINQVSSGA